MTIFARFGTITGEATAQDYEGWVEVESFSWGAAVPESAETGRTRHGAVVGDLTLTFAYEKSAPRLLEHALRGSELDRVDVHVTSMLDGAQVMLEYALSGAHIIRYDVSGSGENRPEVSAAVEFRKLTVTYHERSPTGTLESTSSTTWSTSA